MAYLGRGLDKISNIEVLDNITFDGSSSYSITKGSVAFTPNSAQSCLISIDGVVQATNFTVSSSTINFGVAVPSTSVCNFFLHYGTGVMTVPSDGSVTTAKLGSNAVSSAKMFSGFANGITEADQWRLNADLQGDQNPIASNLERVDTDGFSVLGTGMTHSSGIFTFPSTGYWDIRAHFQFSSNGTDNQKAGYIETTTDNSSYSGASHCVANFYANGTLASVNTNFLFDCTNTSTHKVRFVVGSTGGTGNVLGSDTNMNFTFFTFIKLGDT
jgi:hypothetical protein